MAQSLPRFMFLDEDSQQMHDKRIQTITYYEQTSSAALKKQKKRIHSIFPHQLFPYNSTIFNLEYSNSQGVLLQATEDEVLALPLPQLQSSLKAGNIDKSKFDKLEFAGELFLSPNEELLAICSHSLVQIVIMSELPAISLVPVPNSHNCHRFLWVGDSHILLWSFMEKAYLLQIDIANLSANKMQQLSGVKECTGASIVGDSLLIAEARNVKVFDFGSTTAKKEVCLDYQDHANYLYNYSTIVEIFRVNVHGSPQDLNSRMKAPLCKDDILGLVMVYYDDDEEEPDQRFLTFFKGNLLEDDKEFYGNEMFSSSNNTRDVYYEDDQKLSFGVKVLYCGFFICISIERCQATYIVDPFEAIEKLNIYQVNGKTELKDKEGKAFRGIAVMKNMMELEKKYPEDANMPLLERITKDFGGQFMTLYFASQETNLNLPFPPSVIAITDKQFYRKYAISALQAIDKDDDKDIIKEMEKIKKSPHIIIPSKIESDKKIEKKEVKKEEKPKNVENKIQKPIEKKKQPNNLFLNKPVAENVTPALVSAPKEQTKPSPFSGLFSTKSSPSPNLFNNPSGGTAGSSVANMLADKTIPQKPIASEVKKQEKPQEKGNIFGGGAGNFNASSSPFSQNIFGKIKQENPSICSSLFKPDAAKKEDPKSEAFSSVFKQAEQPKKEAPVVSKPAEQMKIVEPCKAGFFKNDGTPSIWSQPAKTQAKIQEPKAQPKKEDKPFFISNAQPKQAQSDQNHALQKQRRQMVGKLNPGIVKIKEDLIRIKEGQSFSVRRNLKQLRQFAEKQLQYLKKGEEFYLGAPLCLLLQKGQSISKSSNYLRLLLREEASLQNQVKQQLKNIDDDLNRALFFTNVMDPPRKRVDSLEDALNRLNHIDDLLEERRSELEDDLDEMFGELQQLNLSLEKRKMNMSSSVISNTSKGKRSYNFSSFNEKTSKNPPSSRLETKSKQENHVRSQLKYNDEVLTVILMKDSQRKPLVKLEQFDILKPANPPPSSRPQQKFASSQSMASINQSRALGSSSKPKEKINVPMVNTKMLDLKEQVAESEQMEKSDDDLIALPTSVRQMSQIDTSPRLNEDSDKNLSEKKDKTQKQSKKVQQIPKPSGSLFGLSQPKQGGGKSSLFGVQTPNKKEEKKDDQKDDQKDDKKVDKKEEGEKKAEKSSASMFGNLNLGTSSAFSSFGKAQGGQFGTKDQKVEKKEQKKETKEDNSQKAPPLDKPKSSARSEPDVPKVLPNTFTLMQQKEGPKKEDQKKSQDEPKKATNLFGLGNTSIFGPPKGTSIVAASTLSSNSDEKKAEKANGSGSMPFSNKDNKKEETDSTAPKNEPSPSAPFAGLFNKGPTTGVTDADIQKQKQSKQKEEAQSKPKEGTSQPLYPPRPQQPPTATTQPTLPIAQHAPHGQGVPSTAFGCTNRFLSSENNQAQSTGFDPKAMSFEGGKTTQRTFGSIGGDQGNMFNKQPQNNTFSQNMFANASSQPSNPFNQSSNMNAQQNSQGASIFGGNSSAPQQPAFSQQQNQGGMFGQMSQGNSMMGGNQGNLFGQTNQGGGMFPNAQGGGNFLMNMGSNQTQPLPQGGSSNLMAMRK